VDRIKVEPTQDDLDALARHEHQQLVVAAKARHRRAVYAGKLPSELPAKFASRILKRDILVLEDCTDAELEMLMEWIFNGGGERVTGSNL